MKEQVAVVTFNPVPSSLQEATDGPQQLQMRMMEGTSLTPIANFDSHFIHSPQHAKKDEETLFEFGRPSILRLGLNTAAA